MTVCAHSYLLSPVRERFSLALSSYQRLNRSVSSSGKFSRHGHNGFHGLSHTSFLQANFRHCKCSAASFPPISFYLLFVISLTPSASSAQVLRSIQSTRRFSQLLRDDLGPATVVGNPFEEVKLLLITIALPLTPMVHCGLQIARHALESMTICEQVWWRMTSIQSFSWQRTSSKV